jgi:hypothetical protein
MSSPAFDPLRRCDELRQTTVEHAILEAMRLVESLGADPRLTDAVVLLGRARDAIADFVDKVERPRALDVDAKLSRLNKRLNQFRRMVLKLSDDLAADELGL